MENAFVEMRGIRKSFGENVVLKSVDFQLEQGTVHAVIGGNGAGKSTLMKILTGVYTLDEGEILIMGERKRFHSASDAKANGIEMIYQELSLIQSMSVAENIFLGQEIKKHVFRDVKKMNAQAKELLSSLGIDIDPSTKVETLSVGMSQIIEIAKALSKNARILVFDEPTAALSSTETKLLFKIIRDLKEKNVALVYISHRMNEIMEIADKVTILKDGEKIITSDMKDLSLQDIISLMLGKTEKDKLTWHERNYSKVAEPLLEVNNLSVDGKVHNLSFSVQPGEILGLAGLTGSGRTETLEALFGIRKIKNGLVKINGKVVNIKNTRDAVLAKMALVPEDRRKEGLVLIHSVKENYILPTISKKPGKSFSFINERKANIDTQEAVSKFHIVTDSINKMASKLSGGNQQKIVISKWLRSQPNILLMDEPTAGVDIGAKDEIIQITRKFADTGGCVIFVSSELTELLAACDRIIVLFDGKKSGEMERKEIEGEEALEYAIQKGL